MEAEQTKCFVLFCRLSDYLDDGRNLLRAYGEMPTATEPQAEGKSLMSEETPLRDLFDRWERVWHEGQYDLVAQCVQPNYIRHDEAGDRTVTREAYAEEIAKTRKERPDVRIVVYDHTFEGNRAWFRFEFKWTDPKTGEKRTLAGMQVYRIEDGKLAETWLILQPLARFIHESGA
jgi:predicted SnoaL-like aldol condensation-catalyzing enzyme